MFITIELIEGCQKDDLLHSLFSLCSFVKKKNNRKTKK